MSWIRLSCCSRPFITDSPFKTFNFSKICKKNPSRFLNSVQRKYWTPNISQDTPKQTHWTRSHLHLWPAQIYNWVQHVDWSCGNTCKFKRITKIVSKTTTFSIINIMFYLFVGLKKREMLISFSVTATLNYLYEALKCIPANLTKLWASPALVAFSFPVLTL